MDLIQARTLFFSQYLYQDVLQHGTFDVTRLYASSATYDRHLLLRSVNQLTNSELKTVWTIFEGEQDNGMPDKSFQMGGFWISTIIDVDSLFPTTKPSQIAALFAYLRSVGILIPFTYLDENRQPVTLSVEDIIKLEWAKIPS